MMLATSHSGPVTMGGCLELMVAIATITVICFSILYEVFGVSYLIIDYQLFKSCNGSHLWEYSLTSLLLHFLSSLHISASSFQELQIIYLKLWCMTVVYIGFSIWGGFELFSFACDEVKGSGLYYFAYVSFILQIVGALTLALFPYIIILILYYAQSVEITEPPIESESANQRVSAI
jgi:hypothetical protein